MTTVYPAIADALLPVLPAFTIAGPTFTVTRTTAGTPAADASTASAGTVTLFIVDNTGGRFRASEAGTGIWQNDFLAFGATDVAIQQGEVLDDGAASFVVTGTPQTHLGLLIAPVERTSQ